MRKFSSLWLLIPLIFLAGLYFLLSYANGGICFQSPTCTSDTKTLCRPRKDMEVWQVPSLCSCGLDADVLKSRGWLECEIPEDYKGKIRTTSSLVDLSTIQIPETLPLFIVPTISLSLGVGALIVLWTKKE